MSRAARRPARIHMPYVEQLAERLSPRDRMIILTLNRTHIASGAQLERLHFYELTGRSRSVKRADVLNRLTAAGVLAPIERRIGTANRGSAQQRYVLDTAGQQLVRLYLSGEFPKTRVRRPRAPGGKFIAHALAVTELYVGLVERARSGTFVLGEFQAEADAYWPDGHGGWVRMDAFIRLERGGIAHYWWYEADMPRHDSDFGNETLPIIRSKFLGYLDFVHRGQLGPDGVVPKVLTGVPNGKRLAGVQSVIDELPAPAESLFRVVEQTRAAQLMADEITSEVGGAHE